jgi:F420-dependent oxidoreductase-like protein
MCDADRVTHDSETIHTHETKEDTYTMTSAQIGIMIEGQDGLNWQRWDTILKTAERVGYQCVFRSDHFTNASGPHKDALELWTSLTYAATVTDRIEFGSLVVPITFRHPSMLVQYAAAVDMLAQGRFVFGLGTGWQDREHREFGIPFPPLSERYQRLEDGLEMAKRLFHSDDPVSYDGHHYQLDGALLTMKRAGGPPILIGGNGPKKTLPLAAKYASEWNAVYADPETFVDRTQLLDRYLADEGRAASDVKRSLMMRAIYGDDARIQQITAQMSNDRRTITKDDLVERGFIIGQGQEIVDQVGAWVERGVERFMLQWLEPDNMDGLEAMAQDLLPHFHAADAHQSPSGV